MLQPCYNGAAIKFLQPTSYKPMSYLPAHVRDRLLEADNRHCAYCHTSEANTGQPMTVDHILSPKRKAVKPAMKTCALPVAAVTSSKVALLALRIP